MGFVCLELVPMKEPPNPFHPQPFKDLCKNNHTILFQLPVWP